MKNIEQYIQEKFLIDFDTDEQTISEPVDEKLPIFQAWLKQEFDFTDNEIKTFYEKLLKRTKLTENDINLHIFLQKVNFFAKQRGDKVLRVFRNRFKNIENKKNHLLIANENYSIYYYSLMTNESKQTIKRIVVISDHSDNPLYMYLIEEI